MTLGFPVSPSVGDIHTVGTRSWRWDGSIWSSKPGSESRWTQVLDDPGTSLTNWTSVDGTWALDTYIENTDTSGWSYMEWNGSFSSTTIMIQAEFYVPTPGTANYPGGYICLARSSESGFNKIKYRPCVANYNNHISGAGTWAMFISGSNDSVNRHIELNNGIGAYDTWTTMSIVSDGGSFYGYINGNYIGNVGTADTRPWDTFAIACYGTEIKYRNIKAWQAVNDLPSGGQIPIPVEVLADGVSLTTSVDSIDFIGTSRLTEPTADNVVVEVAGNRLDLAPASPNADNEEFDVDLGAFTVLSGTPGTVEMFSNTAGTYEVTESWLRAWPGGGSNIVLRLDRTLADGESVVGKFLTGSFHLAGFVLNDLDSDPTSTTTSSRISLWFDPASTRIIAYNAGSSVGTTSISNSAGTYYLRIARVGTVYRLFCSQSGDSWLQVGSVTSATAPSNIWLYLRRDATAVDGDSICGCDWVRFGTNDLHPW